MDNKMISVSGLCLAAMIMVHGFASFTYMQTHPISFENKMTKTEAINDLNKKYMEVHAHDFDKKIVNNNFYTDEYASAEYGSQVHPQSEQKFEPNYD